MSEVKRYMVSYATGVGESAMPSETGNWVKFTDHADRVRELEEAVRVLAEMWQCETRVNLFAKLPDNDSRKENAGRDFDEAYQRVLENPIAADAVKEAGR
jgi:hypothetical protein